METEEFVAALAAEIDHALKTVGKTRHWLSQAAGIPSATLTRRLRTPAMSPFTVNELVAVSSALALAVSQLVARAEASLGVAR